MGRGAGEVPTMAGGKRLIRDKDCRSRTRRWWGFLIDNVKLEFWSSRPKGDSYSRLAQNGAIALGAHSQGHHEGLFCTQRSKRQVALQALTFCVYALIMINSYQVGVTMTLISTADWD